MRERPRSREDTHPELRPVPAGEYEVVGGQMQASFDLVPSPLEHEGLDLSNPENLVSGIMRVTQ